MADMSISRSEIDEFHAFIRKDLSQTVNKKTIQYGFDFKSGNPFASQNNAMSFTQVARNGDETAIVNKKAIKIQDEESACPWGRPSGRSTMFNGGRESLFSTAESQEMNRQLSDIFLGRTTLFEQEGVADLSCDPFKASWCSNNLQMQQPEQDDMDDDNEFERASDDLCNSLDNEFNEQTYNESQ